MKFGERLKQARTDLGLTQEVVAHELHVARQTISSWENERSYPDINSLIHLSNYYQLSLDILLKEDTQMVEEIRKKEELARINKMSIVSSSINLIFFLMVLLSQLSSNQLFAMGDMIRLSLIVAMFLNASLLFYFKRAKTELNNNAVASQLKVNGRLKLILMLEGLVVIVGLVLWFMEQPKGDQVTGFGVGMLCATLILVVVYRFINAKK